MPGPIKILPFKFLVIVTILFNCFQVPVLKAYEGIQKYYVRYEVKSSRNRIKNENLLMIPVKNEFRSEKFSHQIISGAISADSGFKNKHIDLIIQEDALKTILKNEGLKSVHIKDVDTIISYEGAILSPINILSKSYDPTENRYQYNLEIEFSPIAFPDQWKNKKNVHNLKSIISDFLELFK